MSHGQILTNAERRRRHFSMSSMSVWCQIQEEDILHAIWDCGRAKEVWTLLVPNDKTMEFFALGLQEWFSWMWQMRRRNGIITRWPERLILVCWMQWKWRNMEIFEGVKLDIQQRLRQVRGR